MIRGMKVLLCALLALSMLTGDVCAVAETAEEKTTPAQAMLDRITIGWNLGNTLDSFNTAKQGAEGLEAETCWGNPKTSPELLQLVHDNGFDLIRVPTTWYTHMDENDIVDPAWMDRVQQVVDDVLATGSLCLLNVHHDTGEKGWLRASDKDYEVKSARFVTLWKQIAERFKDYDERLMFEGFNEILNEKNLWNGMDKRALEVTNDLNRLFVETVRASGSKNAERVLVLNTYCAGPGIDVLSGFVLPEDSVEGSLIVSAHVYQPWSFTDGNQKNVTNWSKGPIDTALNGLKRYFTDKGIPVLIGEFGAENKGNMDKILSWAAYYVTKCRELGFKAVWWDNGALFKLFSRKNLAVSNEALVRTLVAAAKGEPTDQWATPDVKGPADDLCGDADYWTSWVNTGSGAAAEIACTDHGFVAKVEKSGKDSWLVQPAYKPLKLENGVTYKLEFDVTADQNIPFRVVFQQDYGTYQNFFFKDIQAGTETKHITYTFKNVKNTDDNLALVFNLGGHPKLCPYTVTVDHVSLKIVQPESADK